MMIPGFCGKKKGLKGILTGDSGIRKVLLVELVGQLAPLAPCVPDSPEMGDNIGNEPSHKLSN